MEKLTSPINSALSEKAQYFEGLRKERAELKAEFETISKNNQIILDELARRKTERIKNNQDQQFSLNMKKLEKVVGKSKEAIGKKVKQAHEITSNMYNWLVRRPLVTLGIVGIGLTAYGTTALVGGKSSDTSKKNLEKNVTLEDSDSKEQEFKSLSEEVSAKVDTEYYKDFSRPAQEAYLSRISVGIAEEKNPTVLDTTIVADSTNAEDTVKMFTLERAPKPAGYIEQFGISIRKFESRNQYGVESDSSSAAGAYQFLASWLKYLKEDFEAVDINDPESDEAYEYYLAHPEMQDRLFRMAVPMMAASIPNFDSNNTNHIAKLFAVYFVGPEGVTKYGTPAGDYVPKKNNISLNSCVRQRVKEFLEAKEATKNPGWWLVDKESHTRYWVQADGKVTYETDIYQVADNSEDDISSKSIGTATEVAQVYKMADMLEKNSRTANYVEEHSKYQEKAKEKKQTVKKSPASKKTSRIVASVNKTKKNTGGIVLTSLPEGGL